MALCPKCKNVLKKSEDGEYYICDTCKKRYKIKKKAPVAHKNITEDIDNPDKKDEIDKEYTYNDQDKSYTGETDSQILKHDEPETTSSSFVSSEEQENSENQGTPEEQDLQDTSEEQSSENTPAEQVEDPADQVNENRSLEAEKLLNQAWKNAWDAPLEDIKTTTENDSQNDTEVQTDIESGITQDERLFIDLVTKNPDIDSLAGEEAGNNDTEGSDQKEGPDQNSSVKHKRNASKSKKLFILLTSGITLLLLSICALIIVFVVPNIISSKEQVKNSNLNQINTSSVVLSGEKSITTDGTIKKSRIVTLMNSIVDEDYIIDWERIDDQTIKYTKEDGNVVIYSGPWEIREVTVYQDME